ncbi:MAG: hypothetical protein JXR39_12345 [Marinilabiliaceae bacterium]|nr:hypothetical protein [Marinilabiliaceae bacterium]
MIRTLLFIVCLLMTSLASSQNHEVKGVVAFRRSISASTGLAVVELSNRAFNHYTYRGTTVVSVELSGSMTMGRWGMQSDLRWMSATLSPVWMDATLYETNELKYRSLQWQTTFEREVFRSSWAGYFSGGMGVRLGWMHQNQAYNNLLYEFGAGVRRHFEVLLPQLSPMIVWRNHWKQFVFHVQASAPLLTVAAHPDDNYIKQTGYQAKMHWGIYTPAQRFGFNAEAGVMWLLSRRMQATSSWVMETYQGNQPDVFRENVHMFCLGMRYVF